jgi:type VI secretion system protein ImpA
MASTANIDIDRLLKPISEESPVGANIREDNSPSSPYQTIKTVRSEARAAERNNIFDGDNNEADECWRKILELAPPILEDLSKDLEIASWYTEALLRRYSFSGLRDGFELIFRLIERYWADVYPAPDDDEDGIEAKTAPLAGLNGEGSEGVLIAPIRSAQLTQEDGYSLWQYQQALDIHRLPDEAARQEKSSKLGFSLDQIEKSVAESSDIFFIDLRDDVSACIELYRKTSQLLDQHCGTNKAPPTSNILNVLDECLSAINHLGDSKFPEELSEDTQSASEDANSDSSQGSGAVKAGPINSREAAFKQLRDIAAFFRKTEPHSPISYVLEKAVKWGNMPLEELIVELIPDEPSRGHYSTLTGVKVHDDNE